MIRVERPDWTQLQPAISGRVLLPRDEGFEPARKSFIARFDEVCPLAIVRGRSANDFAVAVTFARRNGLPIAIRGGGHSAAGYSSTRGILLDLASLSFVSVCADAVVIGAGTRTGHVCEQLAERGLVIPVGTCPSVGIGGLTLGGGFGSLGRKYGLTLDHLLRAQIVLSNGEVLECDEEHHPDLFWALRGAGGGNFGVVTRLEFLALSIPQMTSFEIGWSPEYAAAVVAGWQSWAPAAIDELNAEMTLDSSGDVEQESGVQVYGVHLGGERAACAILDQLIQRVGATSRRYSCVELPYREVLSRQAASSATNALPEQMPNGTIRRQGHRVMKSELFRRELPREVIADLVGGLYAGTPRGEHRSIEFAPWGGAYGRRSPHATAFVHRGELYSIQHSASVDPVAAPSAKQAAHGWVAQSWARVRSAGSGRVYQNFPDPELRDWGPAYYGENFPRLLEVKREYDPDDVFCFEQSIRVREEEH